MKGHAVRPYADVVADFVASGALLMRDAIASRYKGLVAGGTRLLEPGFVPPDRPAKVLIVSYYPNATDRYKPGTAAYEAARGHLFAWRDDGSVAAYTAAYADWLGSLDRIPFHRTRTRPILETAGLTNDEIAWLPFVKVPLPAGFGPGEAIQDCDIDTTWAQIQLLRPSIVWIQGMAIAPRIQNLVKERITDDILPIQSVSQYGSAAKREEERDRLARRLREYLAKTMASEDDSM
ncbi:MAG: hypothetical protein IAI50_11195 [Candidatus Eremiobacteraeota bacterium]|nr:hypothetical protein [Candidatus Eremiobacteraeota bacterium]